MAASRQNRKKGGRLTLIAAGAGIIPAFSLAGQAGTALKETVFSIFTGGAVLGLIVFLPILLKRQSFNPTARLPIRKALHEALPAARFANGESDRESPKVSNDNGQVDKQWSLELIKSLDWKRFEELCGAYFEAKGRKIRITELGADGGVDLVLFGCHKPEKVLGVVQCKAWAQKPVGVKEIRELLGIMTHMECPLGVYITTSDYTPDAKAFASNKHIKLINADGLLALIFQLSSDVRHRLLERITEGDYTTPSCPNCGVKLVSRTARQGPRAGRKF